MKAKYYIIIIMISLANNARSQKTNDDNAKASFSFSYYHVKDCPCEFEPKEGYPYYPSVGPLVSYHDDLFRKLQMRFSLGFFNHSYSSTRVDDSGLHGSGRLIFNELKHNTRNYFTSGHLGFSIASKRLKVIPEIGFYYFRRKIIRTNRTKYTFTELYDGYYSLSEWPDAEPSKVDHIEQNYSSNRWDSMAGSIGFTGYYTLNNRTMVNFHAHLLKSATWVEDYQLSLHFMQAGIGLALKLGKTNGLND